MYCKHFHFYGRKFYKTFIFSPSAKDTLRAIRDPAALRDLMSKISGIVRQSYDRYDYVIALKLWREMLD